jgi:hypothetical protein
VATRIDAPIHVRWLQTQCCGSAVSSSFYADLRIAADRPDFAGVCSLAECNDAQLAWLCTQKRLAASFLCNAALTPVAIFSKIHPSLCLFVSSSFAGIMFFDKVALDAQARGAICGDGSTPGGKCTWHRAIDFQPNTGAPDEGFAFLKRSDARTMFEYGTAWDYKEVCHLHLEFFLVHSVLHLLIRRGWRVFTLCVYQTWVREDEPRADALPFTIAFELEYEEIAPTSPSLSSSSAVDESSCAQRQPRHGFLVVCGSHFVLVLARRDGILLPAGASLAELVVRLQPDRCALGEI